jgi:hypothetical protein
MGGFMIRVIFYYFLLSLLVSCGKDDPPAGGGPPAPEPVPKFNEGCTVSQELTGSWETLNGSIVLVKADCSFTSSYCGFNGTFNSWEFGTSDILMGVENSNNTTGCLSNGVHSCTYELVEQSVYYKLTLVCSVGTDILYKPTTATEEQMNPDVPLADYISPVETKGPKAFGHPKKGDDQ